MARASIRQVTLLVLLCAACGTPASLEGPASTGTPPAHATEEGELGARVARGAEPPAAAPGDALAGLAAAIPAGWTFTIVEREPGAPLSPVAVDFARPEMTCEIPFGGGADVRHVTPEIHIVLHPLETEAALHAAEEPFRLLSSHCPADVELARTSAHFVAVSPCDRVFAFDPACAAAATELESALRTYLAGR